MTINILFPDDNKKMIITHTKNECHKTQGFLSIRNTCLATVESILSRLKALYILYTKISMRQVCEGLA